MINQNTQTDQVGKLLTVNDLSQILGVHPGTIYRGKAKGVLPWVKLPHSNRVYFPEKAVTEWIQAHQHSPKAF